MDKLPLGPHLKGYPLTAPPSSPQTIAAFGWNLLADDLPYPIAVLADQALTHNVRWMQDFATQRGVAIAPHGKTTMSPELFARQLQAGAWGLTFATIHQVAVGVQAGARRIIVANQVVSEADLNGLAALLEAHPTLQVWFLVDSKAQVALIEDWARRHRHTTPFHCLLEIGIPGKRTGCRTVEQAVALAQTIRASRALRLDGIECYEGGLVQGARDGDRQAVDDFLARVRETAQQCDTHGLFAGDTILLSAGGSAVFDVVAPALKLTLSHPVQGILRSGCYIVHDHKHYADLLHNVEARQGLEHSLQPALTVWTMVQSVPEPGLALLTCGKRDISYDLDLPVPIRHAARGARTLDATPPSWKITALNDQHAYLSFDPHGKTPAVGDRVVLGISHPCTTFDKWAWMPIIDDQCRIVSAITTSF